MSLFVQRGKYNTICQCRDNKCNKMHLTCIDRWRYDKNTRYGIVRKHEQRKADNRTSSMENKSDKLHMTSIL